MIRLATALCAALLIAASAQAAPPVRTLPGQVASDGGSDYQNGVTYYGTKAPSAVDFGGIAIDRSALNQQNANIASGMAAASVKQRAQYDATVNGLITGVMQGNCISMLAGCPAFPR